MNMFFHGNIAPMGDLDQTIQLSHLQERTIVLVVNGDSGIAVRIHVAIGTVRDLVFARRGRGYPRERLDGGGWQDDGGTLCLDGVGREDVRIPRELHQLLLILWVA